MNSALEILRRERDDAAEQIRALRTRIKDLDSAIGVLEGQPLAAKGRGVGDLKLSVLKHLRETSSRGETPKEIAKALTVDGRPTSDASVSSTLSRLKGEAQVINRAGRWFAANEVEDPQNTESAEPGLRVPVGWDDLDEDIPF